MQQLAKYFKSVSGAATAAVGAFPLAGLMVPVLLPAWTGAPIVAVAASVGAIFMSFFRWRRSSPTVIEKRGAVWFRIGVVSAASYLCLNVLCIFRDRDAAVVTGSIKTDEAKSYIASSEATGSTRKDLLAAFGYESNEKIWSDVRLIDLVLDATFVVACTATAT